ncbi:MAG: DUF899 domain-containing protein [Planctomycetales bacterium]|nr:DUF899 domain-containing protein [bacterium]UNM08882.1 MAG: DUF899 domain-containing protein [Planctomycetales bacterium]
MDQEKQAEGHPPIVGREQWLAMRRELLGEEKAATRLRDAVNAKRRRLPMVKLDKQYSFQGEDGEQGLLELFAGQRQLVVYHFMFDPSWEKGCPGCTGLVDEIGDISMLADRNTRFVLVSRAPFEKLAGYRNEKGWDIPWYSSHDSDFNYDFHASIDESRAPFLGNFRSRQELEELGRKVPQSGEIPGASVFFRIGNDIYHTYSTWARGVESLTDSYAILDITPWGRQEDFEDSPAGYPQKPTYG